jgi:hypothetical protein
MAIAIHERWVGIHWNQLLLVDTREAGVVWNEIWVLFVVDSLNFPSRFDARACWRLEFRTRKGIRLSKSRKKALNFVLWDFFRRVSLTANVSCFKSEHLDSMLYLSSLTISFLIFLDFQYKRAMIVIPRRSSVKTKPKNIGDGCDACLTRSLCCFL